MDTPAAYSVRFDLMQRYGLSEIRDLGGHTATVDDPAKPGGKLRLRVYRTVAVRPNGDTLTDDVDAALAMLHPDPWLFRLGNLALYLEHFEGKAREAAGS